MQGLYLWLGAGAVLLATAAGVYLGRRASRRRDAWWLAGFLVPLAVVAAAGAVRWFPELAAWGPLSWLAGRGQFALLAGASAMLLVTPLSRLPRPRDRTWVVLFLALAIGHAGLCPVLLPALLRERHAALPTLLDGDGVCRQVDAYTCGPAAAVTALRWLGVQAETGDLAVRALTTPITGTLPGLLGRAIEEGHDGEGLRCTYRRFRGVGDIPHGPGAVTIAVIKHSFLIDHYVAVKSAGRGTVTTGDPLRGLVTCSEAEFLDLWRRTGIVIEKKPEDAPAAKRGAPSGVDGGSSPPRRS